MRGNGQQVGNKPETASTSQRNIHFLGGVVIPGAFQQNVTPPEQGLGSYTRIDQVLSTGLWASA